jgi:hypothetical protein
MKRANNFLTGVAGVVMATAMFMVVQPTNGQTQVFGGADDVSYAEALWAELESARLVGDNSMYSHFYQGIEPHGFVLEVFDSDLTVGEHTGRVVVKRNYGPEGVLPEDVSINPSGHLAAITVMYKREAGYDEDNQNWFWAKFLPNGDLDKNPKDMQLAGRVAKGADVGCIACHSAAPGEDYIFVTDRPD